MEKTILAQIANIKNITVSLMTYHKERMTLNERALVEKLYYLMDDIVCDRIHHKHYTTEEYVDSMLMENAIVLKRTKNSEIKKLVNLLERGLKW
jgi:hypothetical protein